MIKLVLILNEVFEFNESDLGAFKNTHSTFLFIDIQLTIYWLCGRNKKPNCLNLREDNQSRHENWIFWLDCANLYLLIINSLFRNSKAWWRDGQNQQCPGKFSYLFYYLHIHSRNMFWGNKNLSYGFLFFHLCHPDLAEVPAKWVN